MLSLSLSPLYPTISPLWLSLSALSPTLQRSAGRRVLTQWAGGERLQTAPPDRTTRNECGPASHFDRQVAEHVGVDRLRRVLGIAALLLGALKLVDFAPVRFSATSHVRA